MADLVEAARRGDLSEVKKKLKKSRDSRAHVDSALRHAAMMGHVDIVTYLLKHGANIRARGQLGRTALMTAVQCTNAQRADAIIPLLCNAGADVNEQDDHGRTPLMLACEFGQVSSIHELLSRGANVSPQEGGKGYSALHVAAQGMTGVKVATLLAAGANVNAVSIEGATPLMVATCQGNMDAAQHLVNKVFNVNHRMGNGRTCLHLACVHRQTHILRLLLQYGADPNVPDNDGRRAIHESCKEDNLTALKLLMDHHADADAVANDGTTPLHVAATKRSLSLVEQLLQRAQKPDASNHARHTPLMLAVQHVAIDVVRELLATSRVSPDARDTAGDHVLHMACAVNSPDIVRMLLEQNARLEVKNAKLQTPLHVAALMGHLDCARPILRKQFVDSPGPTRPLKAAASLPFTSTTNEYESIRPGASTMPGLYCGLPRHPFLDAPRHPLLGASVDGYETPHHGSTMPRAAGAASKNPPRDPTGCEIIPRDLVARMIEDTDDQKLRQFILENITRYNL